MKKFTESLTLQQISEILYKVRDIFYDKIDSNKIKIDDAVQYAESNYSIFEFILNKDPGDIDNIIEYLNKLKNVLDDINIECPYKNIIKLDQGNFILVIKIDYFKLKETNLFKSLSKNNKYNL